MNKKQGEQFLAECAVRKKKTQEENAAKGLIDISRTSTDLVGGTYTIRGLEVRKATKRWDIMDRKLIDQKLINDTKQYLPFMLLSNLFAEHCAENKFLTQEERDRLCALFTVNMLGHTGVIFGKPSGNNRLLYEIDFFPHYPSEDPGNGFLVRVKKGKNTLFSKELYIPYSYYESGLLDAFSDGDQGLIKKKYNRPMILVEGELAYNG